MEFSTTDYMNLISIMLIIGGFLLVFLMRDRLTSNVIMWGLFPIIHGFHEIIEVNLVDDHEFFFRSQIFLAFLSSIILLAATIDFHQTFDEMMGGYVLFIFGTLAAILIYVPPYDIMQSLESHTIIEVGGLQSHYFKFYYGIIITGISVLVFNITYFKGIAENKFIIEPYNKLNLFYIFLIYSSFSFFEAFDPSFNHAETIEAVSVVFIFFIPMYLVISTMPKPIEKVILQSIEHVNKKVLVINRNGVILHENKGQTAGSGVSTVQQSNGIQIGEFISNEYGSLLYNKKPFEIETVISKGKLWKGEISFVNSNNHILWIEINLIPVEQNKNRYYLIEFEDITDRKKIEQQLFVIQKLGTIGKLAGGMAHEINNNLMKIIGYADLALLDTNLGEKTTTNITSLKEFATQTGNTIDQLLIYTGNTSMSSDWTDLNDLIIGAFNPLRAALPNTISVNFDIGQNIPHARMDQAMIKQVVVNLIENAIDAIGDNRGNISISSGKIQIDKYFISDSNFEYNLRPGEFVYFEISDTGIGIEVEEFESIFDPFFTTKFIGRGLGLAVVSGILRAHNAAIQVKSEKGKGSWFKILLPV
ncbi:MAG: two-component system sensor histidine kinase NtrB [Candidatus Kariarchaeaceae archaeon]